MRHAIICFAYVLVHSYVVVPERIRDNRAGYVAGLQAADRAWEQGNLDFSVLEDYLAGLLQAQLSDDGISNPGPVA